ncbi:MAG: bifunctional riboflavin kinase/FAD synthetase [Flavobacteriaceae bacterium]|nr:bifunctional riboflavin kinase/FAD synthetase [Flavobacteriaceae bacterium]
MKAYTSADQFKSNKATAVTIGTFDGVHIGHKKIIEQLCNVAKKEGLDSVLLSFFPHPRMVLQKDLSIKLINTLEERRALFLKTGLDHLVVHPFTKNFSRWSAEEFVKTILVDRLGIKKLIIGYDHRFGKNRTANIQDLLDYGKEYGFEVEEIPAQQISEVSVSSTKIRKLLTEGEIEKANQYLGYHFSLSGKVVKGKGLGKSLGTATANIHIKEDYKLIPKKGVYVVMSNIEGKKTYGLMNIGVNPTLGENPLSLEAHFFKLDKDLYNTTLNVELLKRVRDEKTFNNTEELKKAIAEDISFAEAYIKTLKDD